MLKPPDTLSDLARADIEELESKGVDLTPDDIVRINAVAYAVDNPHSRMAMARGVPVKLDTEYLWPFTLAGQSWYRRNAEYMRGDREHTWCLAYCFAHGRNEILHEGKAARKAVKEWAAKLRVRHAEIVEAVDAVMSQDDAVETETPGEPDEPRNTMTAGELALLMAALTKTDAEIWEYRYSQSYVRAYIDAVIQQNKADGESSTADPRIQGERARGLLIKAILDRHERQYGET